MIERPSNEHFVYLTKPFRNVPFIIPIIVVVSAVNGNKADFQLLKEDEANRWPSLGKPLSGHNALHLNSSRGNPVGKITKKKV